jgi:putative exosortase-associated protein (TIGR04073 family)
MTKFNHFFVSILLTGLFVVFAPETHADEQLPQQSYGNKVGQKAARAVANLGTAWLEIPKNMINVTNQSNVFYGVVGGLFKGLVHTAGRLGVAVADLITIPLPTKPIAHPIYIWEDFDRDTVYGDTFRLDPPQQTEQPQPTAPMPAPQPVKPVATPPAPPVDYSNQYNQDTNRKLDSMFKKEMMK